MRLAPSAEVVVKVNHADCVEDRLAHELDRGVAGVGDDVGVADVEAERNPRRAHALSQAA